ncbi:MAG: S8 family serine peptidase [Sandaracinus sp.]|nr:S8 family serine peptidase [Sandaracinus sp.]
MKRLLSFSLLLALACGGSPAPAPVVAEPEPPPAAPAPPPEPEAPADPWESMTGVALRDYVGEQAFTKLMEVQPGTTPEALASWLASPAEAPALTGKAIERLFDLAAVSLAAGDLDRAEKIIRLVREKAANRNSAFAGNTYLAEIARRRHADDEAAAKDAVAAVFREQPRTRFGASTVIFQLFQTTEQASAQLGQIHRQLVSLDTASGALFYEQILPGIIENRALFLAAADVVRAEHDAQPALRAYTFPTVDLTRARDAREVRVAVWDVGTNPALFERQLFSNPNEQANDQDDDGNGLVDDVHGVAQDVGDYDHEALLFDPGAEVLQEYAPFLQGIMDLRAGLASSEAAQRVLALMRSVTDPDQLEALERNLDAVGEWAHGTHVAGILLAGLPQAKMAIFRSSWAGEARLYHHRGPTDEELAAERTNVEQIAAFINAHEIKVVNASLGFGEDYVAGQLRHERDRYADDAAVMARAAEIQAHRGETWRQVFAACPNTLFVVAAGNSNRDVAEYGDVPANLQAENVLVIGAVDRYGAWATFTNSNAERVRLFDFGVEVPSLIPDGSTVPLSGTSMASPNAANAAAKLYAVNPGLTPAQAITILVETGRPIAEPFTGRIVDEVAAIARARRERSRRR